MTPNYAFNYFSRFYSIPEDTINKRREMLFKTFGIDQFQEVKYGDLSTGMKQKTSIAVSLCQDPDIVVFDEPTNGLDIITARQVTDYLTELKNRGKTVIISTHLMSLVEKLCDRVLMIIDGESILEEKVPELLNEYPGKDLEEIFFEIYYKKRGAKNE